MSAPAFTPAEVAAAIGEAHWKQRERSEEQNAALVAALRELLTGLAPIGNELHTGRVNGAWPPVPGDARALAAELMRISAPARAALAKAQGAQP